MKRLTATVSLVALALSTAAPALGQVNATGGVMGQGRVTQPGAPTPDMNPGMPTMNPQQVAPDDFERPGTPQANTPMDPKELPDGDLSADAQADGQSDGLADGLADADAEAAAQAEFEQKSAFESWVKTRMDRFAAFSNNTQDWAKDATKDERAAFNDALEDARETFEQVRQAGEEAWEESRDAMVEAVIELDAELDANSS